jgi:NADPH-dependent 2,4-dienoyl-CoA reductase/sulfur reductase-like enzyme
LESFFWANGNVLALFVCGSAEVTPLQKFLLVLSWDVERGVTCFSNSAKSLGVVEVQGGKAMHVVIVGNGVAGTTCALEVRRRIGDCQISLVSGESPYFFSRTALMYSFMDKLRPRDLEPFERGVYDAQKIERVQDQAVLLDSAQKRIVLKNQGPLNYDHLVLACGAVPNMFPWTGVKDHVQDNPESNSKSGVVHFVSLKDLAACEELVPSTKRAVVVGGGLIGIELVECLAHHGIQVTFLVRESSFWPQALSEQEGNNATHWMRSHGVEVLLEDELAHVEKDASGRVSRILTRKGHTREVQMLGICVGVKPNVALAKTGSQGPLVRRGILTDHHLHTSAPNVWACGDCAEIVFSQIEDWSRLEATVPTLNETIWYSAKRQGKVVAQNISGDKVKYTPPLYFNSSKLFEVEFTTVGDVQSNFNGKKTFYGESDQGKSSLRIVTKTEGARDVVVGFNVLGARVDHEVLSQWILERKDVKFVLASLQKAQFDVEFGRVPLESYVAAQEQSGVGL